jgi:broad specificity phosphatase PhoE
MSLSKAGIELAHNMAREQCMIFCFSCGKKVTDITDIFTSEMGRTVETAMTIVMALGISAKMHPHAEAQLAANRAQHESFKREYDKETYRDMMTNTEMVEFSKKAILDMFANLDDGAVALAIGHAPFVNIGVAALSKEGMDYPDTKECEGFVLFQDENGTIMVERYISI